MKSFTLREIALAGLIAAIYAVLGLFFAPISFGVYQVRVAEALTVLPFLTRAAIPGLFIGCMVANVYGGLGWQDIVFGSLITLAAAILTRLVYHLSRTKLSELISFLPIILLWVGGLVLLCQGAFQPSVIACAAASASLLVLSTRPRGQLQPSRPIVVALILVSVVVLAGAILLAPAAADSMTFVMGALAISAAWILTVFLTMIRRRGENPNLLIAPLPPVILNAFGVSLYLAPILEFNYWFVVQMVGIGQLIACYLLGLPLLRLLHRRKNLFT